MITIEKQAKNRAFLRAQKRLFVHVLNIVILPAFLTLGWKSPAEAGGFITACKIMFQKTTNNYAYRRLTVRQFMPEFMNDHKAKWLEGTQDPELLVGMTTEEAHQKLSALSREDVTSQAVAVRNETRIANANGISVVVKTRHVRRDMKVAMVDGGMLKTAEYYNKPEMEPFVSLINDLYALHVVPAARMLSATQSVQMRVPGAPTNIRKAAQRPELFLDLSRMKIIDYTFSNTDRPNPGNLLENGNRLIVIDHDLVHPDVLPVPEAAYRALWIDGVKIGQRTEDLPLVMTRETYNALKSVTYDMILNECRQRGIPVSETNVRVVFSATKVLLAEFEKLQQELGVSLVLD